MLRPGFQPRFLTCAVKWHALLGSYSSRDNGPSCSCTYAWVSLGRTVCREAYRLGMYGAGGGCPPISWLRVLLYSCLVDLRCGGEYISWTFRLGYIRSFDRSVWLSSDAQVQREKTKTRGFRLTRIYWKLQARASVFAQKRSKSYVLEYDIINTHLTSPPSSYTNTT